MRRGKTDAVDQVEESGLRPTSRSGMQSGWSDVDFASRSEADFDASKSRSPMPFLTRLRII